MTIRDHLGPRTPENAALRCPFCKGLPTFRPGVCTGEVEYTHHCLLGTVQKRGEWGNIWKSEKQATKAWNQAVKEALAAIRAAKAEGMREAEAIIRGMWASTSVEHSAAILAAAASAERG